ncbi:WD40-repeat-containing domain protein [Infundibulicybe gibba]|nr:WD40-repeat-containing domain protein [Infundibulicybe gibba]
MAECLNLSLQKTFETPTHVSALSFGRVDHLYVGSDDGSIRVYDLPTSKVARAVRGLPSEVASIACLKPSGSGLCDMWVGCNQTAWKFQFESSKLVQTPLDSPLSVRLTVAEDDVVNELVLNAKYTHMAFCTDAGVVGVVDLATQSIKQMKTQHTSICGSVKFIPDRPQEIVSGGYDAEIFHFDYTQTTLLSRRKILSPDNPLGGTSMSPPFIVSMAVSATGVIAAGTADGRLLLGFGGDKRASAKAAKKKRTRKWEGLDVDMSLDMKVADGPVVACAFTESGKLAISTMLGMLTQYDMVYDLETGEGAIPADLPVTWKAKTQAIEKVNAIVVQEKQVVVGGFSKAGKGIVELWVINDTKDDRDV